MQWNSCYTKTRSCLHPSKSTLQIQSYQIPTKVFTIKCVYNYKNLNLAHFSVSRTEYPIGGSIKIGSHVYFLFQVFRIILLFDINVVLMLPCWPDVTIVESDVIIVVPWKLSTGSKHDYLFCNCPLVGILFQVLRITWVSQITATKMKWFLLSTLLLVMVLWYRPAMTQYRGLYAIKQTHKWFDDHEYPSLGLRRGVRTLQRIIVDNKYMISWGYGSNSKT